MPATASPQDSITSRGWTRACGPPTLRTCRPGPWSCVHHVGLVATATVMTYPVSSTDGFSLANYAGLSTCGSMAAPSRAASRVQRTCRHRAHGFQARPVRTRTDRRPCCPPPGVVSVLPAGDASTGPRGRRCHLLSRDAAILLKLVMATERWVNTSGECLVCPEARQSKPCSRGARRPSIRPRAAVYQTSWATHRQQAHRAVESIGEEWGEVAKGDEGEGGKQLTASYSPTARFPAKAEMFD